MSGISGISPIYGGISSGQVASPSSLSNGEAIEPGQIGGAASGSSILSLSSTSLTATSETLLSASAPMLSSNEALGAALLMLILQYLQTSDPTDKQNLTNMITALAGMQQQSQGGSDLLMYSSSSMTMETTQLTIATNQSLGAYSGSAASLQQAPQTDAGSAGLNVVA